MEQLKKRLITAGEVYHEHTAIRAVISAIPYIGGPLDIILSSKGQKIINERIEKFTKSLSEQVKELEESIVNKDFLDSEEWFDLIIKAYSAASKTRQDEKLHLYAKIIKESILINKEFEEEEPELYLKIIEELSVKELKIAMILFDIKEEKIELSTDEKNQFNDATLLSMKFPELAKVDLISIFSRLEKTGLIKEIVGTYLDYKGGGYRINTLFHNLIKFLGSSELI